MSWVMSYDMGSDERECGLELPKPRSLNQTIGAGGSCTLPAGLHVPTTGCGIFEYAERDVEMALTRQALHK